MKDYFLRFANKTESDSILYIVEQDEEETVVTPRFANIDVVGTIHRPTGALDADGNPVIAPLDGWHVNVRVVDGEDDAALLPYAVTPANPQRVWW